MKILLLMPDANIHKISIGPLRVSFREAPLTLTTLAALVPTELNAEIQIIDESVGQLPKGRHFDLVGISCLTGTAQRAYHWAEHFRKRNATVVLGGIHVSLCPDEAAQHAHTIVTGFAETVWPQLLTDFAAKHLKKRYNGRRGDIRKLPLPRRDLQKRWGYAVPYAVSATRGCGHSCSFCSVPAADYGWQTRPIGDVVNEISRIPARRFTFNDVNLLGNREYALELLQAIRPLKKFWGGLAVAATASDPEMLEALRLAGCQYLLCGFESLSEASLNSINKSFNPISSYKNLMEAFHEYGISIQGCFIFGLDDDNQDIFKNTVELVNSIHVDIPRYAISTPYPETGLFRRLQKDGRLLHTHWPHYDTQHVVFEPTKMTAAELDAGFRYAYAETFRIGSIRNRAKNSPHPAITAIGNLAYRRYLKYLNNDNPRIFRKEAE
jgi:radical SAM superfamily enzyme YgiQ (UPF0313 family)